MWSRDLPPGYSPPHFMFAYQPLRRVQGFHFRATINKH